MVHVHLKFNCTLIRNKKWYIDSCSLKFGCRWSYRRFAADNDKHKIVDHRHYITPPFRWVLVSISYLFYWLLVDNHYLTSVYVSSQSCLRVNIVCPKMLWLPVQSHLHFARETCAVVYCIQLTHDDNNINNKVPTLPACCQLLVVLEIPWRLQTRWITYAVV